MHSIGGRAAGASAPALGEGLTDSGLSCCGAGREAGPDRRVSGTTQFSIARWAPSVSIKGSVLQSHAKRALFSDPASPDFLNFPAAVAAAVPSESYQGRSMKWPAGNTP